MVRRNGRVRLVAGAAVCVSSLTLVLPARATDWSQWGGASRNNVTPESSGWPSNWPPAKKWQLSVGNGCSSPVIANVGGTWCVFALGNVSGTDHVYCINAETSTVIWEKTYSCPEYGTNDSGIDHANYKGPQSTPAYDAATGYLYTFSVDGDLYCWNATSNGTQVWFKDVRADYGLGRRPMASAGGDTARDYGFTSSPLVYGNVVVMEAGTTSDKPMLMAFNRSTGSRDWTSSSTEPAGSTNGPVEISVGGTACFAVQGVNNLVVINASNRSTVATYGWSVEFTCNIATPAVWGSDVLLTAAYNQWATHQVRMSAGSASKVRDFGSVHAIVCTPAIHGNYAYMVEGTLKCLDLQNGGQKWQDGSFGQQGNCLVADGDDRVIVWGGNKLALYNTGASLSKVTEVSGILSGGAANAWPHVALGGGYIACRDGVGRLACYSVGSSPTPNVTIDSFAADPAAIGQGASSTLSWATSNASSVTLDGGAVDADGATVVTPAQTTTYTLEAQGEGGPVTQQVTVTVTAPPPPGDLVKIDCGPGAAAGWEDDGAYALSGVEYTFGGMPDTTGVADAAPPEVYQTCRHQAPSFSVPVSDGDHTVRLHFYDEYGGGRAMTVTIEGQEVLSGFSIAAEAGVGNALVKEFFVAASGGDGIQIVFDLGSGNDAFVSGIEIIAGGSPPPPPPSSMTLVSPAGGEAWYVGTTPRIRWDAVGLTSVRIRYTADGGQTYSTVADAVTEGGAGWENYPWTVPNTPSAQCRVLVEGTSAGDPSDESGAFEISAVADSDGDGMDDGWEILHFGDTTNADATTDTDGDGVTDLQEFMAATDPNPGGGGGSLSSFGCAAAGAGSVALVFLALALAGVRAARGARGGIPG